MRSGKAIIWLLVIAVIIGVALIFYIPYKQVFDDKNMIKESLYRTRDYIRGTTSEDITNDQMREYFIGRIEERRKKDQISVMVYPEDFVYEQGDNGFIHLKCRYVNENVLLPIINYRMPVIDTYVEISEFKRR